MIKTDLINIIFCIKHSLPIYKVSEYDKDCEEYVTVIYGDQKQVEDYITNITPSMKREDRKIFSIECCNKEAFNNDIDYYLSEELKENGYIGVDKDVYNSLILDNILGKIEENNLRYIIRGIDNKYITGTIPLNTFDNMINDSNINTFFKYIGKSKFEFNNLNPILKFKICIDFFGYGSILNNSVITSNVYLIKTD